MSNHSFPAPRRGSAALIAVFLLIGFSALSGCGEESDREQVQAVVFGLYGDLSRGDVKGVCDRLTPRARGRAIATEIYPGVPVPPATKDECVTAMLPGRENKILRRVLEGGGLMISKVTISGRRSRVIANAGAIEGVQLLRRTGEGWKVESYENPVRD